MSMHLWRCCRSLWRFRDYRPQRVNLTTLRKWLSQFEPGDRKLLMRLLDHVIYLTKDQTRELLVRRNQLLLKKLKESGIHESRIIYIQIDEAGSSSSLMLNMLKEAAMLEKRNCNFLDSRDISGLHDLTNKIGEGAIIYVDDFIGSGDQFCKSYDFSKDFIIGTFSKFLLSACICEEALYELAPRGVTASTDFIHSVAERPLHDLNSLFEPEEKERLIEIGKRNNKKGGLGYKSLATMVVLYRNAPNSLPRLLRGDMNQNPNVGILPRLQDLPVRK